MNAKTSFRFEGLDELLVGVRRLTNDIAYFTLRDRSVEGESQIGRIDFEPSSLSPYVSVPGSSLASSRACFDDGSDDDADNDDELGPEDQEDASFDDESDASASIHLQGAIPGAARLEFDHATLLTAACRWIRESAICAGRTVPAMHLHLKVYAPKGARVIFSGSFFMQNLYFNKSLADIALRAAQESEARKAASPATASASPTTTSSTPASSIDPVSHEPVLHEPVLHEPVLHESVSRESASKTAPGTPPASPVPTAHPSTASGAQTAIASAASTGSAALPAISTPPPSMLLYPANYQDGSLFGTVGAFRALNEGYTQFGSAMMHGIGQLQDMMNQVLRDRGEELGQYREQLNQLINHVLEFRVKEVEAQTEVAQAQVTDQRTALARDAISQLGDTARAFFVSRGVSPELVDLMNSIGSNPELLGVLQEPSVKAMLSDPENQRALAISLRQIGLQQQALKTMGEAPSPGRASPPPPPATPTVQHPHAPTATAYSNGAYFNGAFGGGAYGNGAYGGGAQVGNAPLPGIHPGGAYSRDSPAPLTSPAMSNTAQAPGLYGAPPFSGAFPNAYGPASPHSPHHSMAAPGYGPGYSAASGTMGWPSAPHAAGQAPPFWPPAPSSMPPAGARSPNHAHYPVSPAGASGAAIGAAWPGVAHAGATNVGAGYPGTGYPGTGYPTTAYPGAGYPGTGYPTTTHPGAGYPGAGYPGTGQAGGSVSMEASSPPAGPVGAAGTLRGAPETPADGHLEPPPRT